MRRGVLPLPCAATARCVYEEEPPGIDRPGRGGEVGGSLALRWLVTLLEFAREKILIPGAPVPIAGRFRNRRARRLAPPPPAVRLVKLRERVRSTRTEGDSGRRLGVRHWRKAHWRRVRYGPGKALERQRWQGRLLIGGPELPMKGEDERIMEVVR